MTESTCAVLSAIFPLIFVTSSIERRVTHLKIRRHVFYRRAHLVTFAFAICGTAYAVIGVAIGGYTPPAGFVLWIIFGGSLLGLAILMIASMATAEIEEEGRAKGRRK